MAIDTRRLDRLAATFHRKPAAEADRLAERIAHMTTQERVRRLAELMLKMKLDREPTDDEINAYVESGDLWRDDPDESDADEPT